LFHVLEHVPNPRLMLERCAGLLKPGGVLVIAVPNDMCSLRTRTKRFLGATGVRRFQRNGRLGLPKVALDQSSGEIHLSQFTPRSLRKLLELCRLSVVWNTLDPYYVATGSALWKHELFYRCCRALKPILGTNLYDTILVVARESASQAANCNPG